MSFHSFLDRAICRENLTEVEAREAMRLVFSGSATTAQLAAWLVALRMKGETAEELAGFAAAMREQMIRVDPGDGPGPLVDTCGTGGDGGRTFNISTVAAFVVSAAGARVAKHGNRSISSKCGSADLLESLGVAITLTPGQMGECLRQTGIAFLFAPSLHPAMRFAQPARLELRTRSVLNLLGPLTNPAGAPIQLIGAFSEHAAELMAGALAALGAHRAFVVHASDGLDEISTTGPTSVFEIFDGQVQKLIVTPGDFGVPVATRQDLQGGTREENRQIALAVLEGAPGPQRDIVLVNAAAALVAAGLEETFAEGFRRAEDALVSGDALRKVRQMAEFTRHAVQPQQDPALTGQ